MSAPEGWSGFLFTYFTGEDTADGETVRFAVSTGPTPDSWAPLHGGAVALRSDVGEQGVRDPFVVAAPDRSRFYLLGTDLRIFGGNDFRAAQERGSRSLLVWESTDLVTWQGPRLAAVSPPEAGNTWAPKAVWDPEHEEYVVFWASALYPAQLDPRERHIADSYQRMVVATTQDFTSFSTPEVWIDERRGDGLGMIDSAVIRQDDHWYRFTKDEGAMLPRLDRSPTLRSTSWELLAERLGEGLPNGHGGVLTQGEGPVAARSVDDERWYLFIDQPPYHGGSGYVSFEVTDLATGTLAPLEGARLPDGARHGSVLRLTASEHTRLLELAGR